MSFMKYYNIKIIFTLATFVVSIQNLQSQENLKEYTEKYPGHNELIVSDLQRYNISINKNKLQVLQDCSYESMILTDLGTKNTTESFTYSELVPVKFYDAYTIKSNKGKDKKIPLHSSITKLARDNSVFYNDVMERKLTYSDLEIGAKKVYQYTAEFIDPFLLHRHIFANNMPIKNSTLEVITADNIEIGYKIFNDPDFKIKFNKEVQKNKIKYSWTLDDIKPLKYESNNPGFLHAAPHVVLYIKNYTIKDEKTELLGNVDLLFEYYKGFVKDLNQGEDASLKSKTLELTANLKTDEEKIKAIYYWVKDHIKYVAFENGYEGFIPREAKLVHERKFGDCKDMSSIITEMAKYAEIPKVNLCWIGTRRIPYNYDQVATPAVDDHMIASIELNGEIIFLDATDNQTRFGLPSSFIQGKDALVKNADSYKIVPVPVVQAKDNLTKDIVKLSLNDSKIKGSGIYSVNGLTRSFYLSQIGDATDKNRFEMIKNLILKGNNKFLLNKYSEKNITDRDLPYEINYDFELDNFAVKAGNEVYLSLFLDKPFEKTTIEKDRTSKFEFDFLTAYEIEYVFEIPTHLKIQSVPNNVTFNNDLLKFEANYVVKENHIYLNFSMETNKIMLSVEDFQTWNDAIKNLKSVYNETIILTKK
ncbi:MAG: DUF3857 domain-containing protein [Flavobacterium sp.]